MNDFSSKALLLFAALTQYKSFPPNWKNGLLQGMFWLSDQLIAATEGQGENDYEHRSAKTIQAYIEQAFNHPDHEISDMAKELCSRILSGIPEGGSHPSS